MNLTLVYNSKAGSSLPLDTLRSVFRTHGITILHEIDITDGFPETLRPHLKKDAYIAALGGDGTLSAVAQELDNSKAIFIPLPGGTLNHFTKDLGVPQDLDEALARLSNLQPRRIDVARVNNTLFLNNSSLGIYPTSLRTREEVQGRFGKWPAAVFATLRALVRFKLYTVTLRNETFKTPFVFVGNNDYHLADNGQRTSLTSGQLCIYAVCSPRRSTLFILLLYALVKKLDKADELLAYHDSELTITTAASRVAISADGELLRLVTPLHYRSDQGALTVLA